MMGTGSEAHAIAHVEQLLGATLPLWTMLPFGLMLLGMATIPLAFPEWWEKNTNKGVLSAALGVPIAIYVGAQDFGILAHTALEYLSFIVLLAALYVIAGGIILRGDLRAVPAVNTGFLALGALLANVIGTTGASMLLIRALIQTNVPERRHVQHIPIFFIFVVSNCAGLLTPLGDPPLFLGYLRGVPFFWTLRLFPQWAFTMTVLLALFYWIDSRALRKEPPSEVIEDILEYQPLSLHGKRNFLYLLGVVAAVLFSPALPEGIVRETVRLGTMIVMAVLSLTSTPQEYRKENGFSFGPINEVAVLFAGIFLTMIPALEILRVRGGALGISEPWHFFWLSGSLSSFLDNAPTYLTFAALAQGVGVHGDQAVPFLGGPVPARLLEAIACGSVFMGANSYIGNGPNFMVKAIAEEQGVKMPSFFGYMGWSITYLIPIFVLVTLIFFRG